MFLAPYNQESLHGTHFGKMKRETLQDLPLGTSSFEALREAGEIYVDKTDFIFQLASKRRKLFLARPRRFGKSLLISTLESLFRHGLAYFRDLKIEKLWKEERTYTVVRLDFSEIRDFRSSEEFSKRLTALLARKFRPAGLNYQLSALFSMPDQLSDWLSTLPANSLVILIDEYDAPLTACLNDLRLFEEVRLKLARFYAALKANDAAFRLIFITGITKFNKTSIFSELNNVSDISLSPEYGSLLGYTHNEVRSYFADYLVRSAAILKDDEEKLFEELARHYDGFCFDRDASQKVFAPWSLLNFFEDPRSGLVDYWFESGGKPNVLQKYLQSHSLRNPEEYGKEKSVPINVLSGSSDPNSLSDIGLLTQTGYLTIKKVEGETVYVGYPNLEVRTAMAQLYIEQLLAGKTLEQAGADKIARRLETEGVDSIVHMLNRLFASLDYMNYPVRNEASLRSFIQVFFSGAGLDPIVEHHNAHGRSDLEVRAGERVWLLELKVAKVGENSERLLREAVDQIKERRYGYSHLDKTIIKVALVFSIEKREFVHWQTCS